MSKLIKYLLPTIVTFAALLNLSCKEKKNAQDTSTLPTTNIKANTNIDVDNDVNRNIISNCRDSIFNIMEKQGFALNDSAAGLINNDKLKDYAYLFSKKDTSNSDAYSLAIIFGGAPNKLILRNDDIFSVASSIKRNPGNIIAKTEIIEKKLIVSFSYTSDYNITEKITSYWGEYIDYNNEIEKEKRVHFCMIVKPIALLITKKMADQQQKGINLTVDLGYKTDSDLSKFEHSKLTPLINDKISDHLKK